MEARVVIFAWDMIGVVIDLVFFGKWLYTKVHAWKLTSTQTSRAHSLGHLQCRSKASSARRFLDIHQTDLRGSKDCGS